MYKCIIYSNLEKILTNPKNTKNKISFNDSNIVICYLLEII